LSVSKVEVAIDRVGTAPSLPPDLSGILTKANLKGASLVKVNPTEAKLSGAVLSLFCYYPRREDIQVPSSCFQVWDWKNLESIQPIHQLV
jgi:hypothetical protein